MTEVTVHSFIWLVATAAALGCSLALLYIGAGLMRVSLEGATSITSKYGRCWLLACCVPGGVVMIFGMVLLWILVTGVARLTP